MRLEDGNGFGERSEFGPKLIEAVVP